MSDTDGRRCLVTGGSSGIGLAVAERLHGEGWAVTAISRRGTAPDGVVGVKGDAADPADLRAAIDAAADTGGRLDGLVCAAGVPPSGPWDDPGRWAEVIRVDLTAAYEASRLAWPALLAARGAVVLIGSIVGSAEGSARSPAYAAAKAGLEGLCRSLAVIGAPGGVRVNVVAPGAIDTPFDVALLPPDARSDVPLGRMGSAGEVASVVSFLLSDAATYVNGAVWRVDGGRSVLSPVAAAIRAAEGGGSANVTERTPVPESGVPIGPWMRRSRRVAYENAWVTIYHDEVQRPDGSDGIYGVVHFEHLAIGVVAIDAHDRVVLVGQHRYALDQVSWEIPEGGGRLEVDPVEEATRELREETGVQAATWRELGRAHLSNSVSDELAVYFLATDITLGDAEPEATEVLDVRWVPFGEVLAMIDRAEITDALSILALQRVALERAGSAPSARTAGANAPGGSP